MIHLIVGRTCSGKSTLEKLMVERGMKAVVSHTTRPPRTPDEPNHIFIQPEELDKFPERLTETVIDGFHYFTTRKHLTDKDVYVIDPVGMYKLCDAMPDEIFTLIHVQCPDIDTRKDRYIARGGDGLDDDTKVELEKEFLRRDASETEQFDDFEKMLQDEDMRSDIMPKNVKCIATVVNDDESDDLLRQVADNMATRAGLIEKMHPFVQIAAKHDVLEMNGDGTLNMYVQGQDEPAHVSVDEMSQCLIDDPEGFVAIMRTLLGKNLITVNEVEANFADQVH